MYDTYAKVLRVFLSTLSLRRATNIFRNLFNRRFDFYPRSPCGERRLAPNPKTKATEFLSTLSLRRATVHYDNYNLHCVISIHALLAESDLKTPCVRLSIEVFLSTLSLRRATRKAFLICLLIRISIHALLAESDPCLLSGIVHIINFYPRSPCGERRRALRQLQPALRHFYPRSPCGERPNAVDQILPGHEFLSTLSLRRATLATR